MTRLKSFFNKIRFWSKRYKNYGEERFSEIPLIGAMAETFRILKNITSPDFKNRRHSDQIRIFNDFAQHFVWRPSDYLGPEYGLSEKSNGHLIVEHGLEHAAAIPFCQRNSSEFKRELVRVKYLLKKSIMLFMSSV